MLPITQSQLFLNFDMLKKPHMPRITKTALLNDSGREK